MDRTASKGNIYSTMAATAVTPHAASYTAAAPQLSSSTTQQRAVSFGFGSLKTPTASEAAAAAALTASATNSCDDNSTTHRQYALYRSSPDDFPSYERLRFVRLPQDWLPAGLRTKNPNEAQSAAAADARNDGSSCSQGQSLQHWPALVYQNLAEVVRDLSPVESKVLKAKLILEHRKCPTTVVARLMAWDTPFSSGNKGKRKEVGPIRNPFEESKLELIRLSGTSLEDNESGGYNELISFVDGQLELENVCDGLIAQHHGSSSADADASESRKVYQHALQFRKAMDMALNCLALDVGADPLPARDDSEQVGLMKTPKIVDGCDGAAAANSTRMPKSALKNNIESQQIKALETSMGSTKHNGEKKQNSKSRSKKSKKFAASDNGGTAVPDKENQLNSGKSSSKDQPKKSKGLTARKNDEPKKKNKSSKKFHSVAAAKHGVKPVSTKANTTTKQSALVRPPSKPTSAKSLSAISLKIDGPASFDFEQPPPPSLEVETPWKEVWAAMKKSGWTWKGGSGLMTDYYYIKPGRKVKNGKEGQDYFISVEGAQAYARTVYRWGSVSKDKVLATIEEYAKYASETVPTLKDGVTVEPHEPWRDMWGKLLLSGWNWKAGSGLMIDYFYIKPGCKVKGGTEGQDYFCLKEDVMKFSIRNYGWRGEEASGSAATISGVDNSSEAGEKRRSSVGSRLSGKHESLGKRQKIATKKMADSKATTQVAEEKKPSKRSSEPKKDSLDFDEESISSDTKSTFSQSGFQSKNLFINEVADENVPALKHPIYQNEPWKEVWEMMRHSGWTWKVGSGLMTEYYYIKPGCKVKGGVKGQDYFVTEEGAKKFAMRNYGWRGDRSMLGMSSNTSSPNRKRRISSEKNANAASSNNIKRQKVVETAKSPKHKALASMKAQKALKAKPAKAAKTSSRPAASSAASDKKAIWQTMQEKGWRVISAGKYNNLHDWYYIRPNCHPRDGTSQLGADFFLSEYEAIEYEHIHSAKHSSEETDKKTHATKTQSPKVSKPPESSKATNNGLMTPAGCRTKPQDPAIPLLSSPDNSCSSTTSEDYYEFTNLWPILQRAGWRAVKATRWDPLADWYYVRPDRDPGDETSKLGRHYFQTTNDVVDFTKRMDKGSARKGGKKSRRSVGVILESFEEEAKASSD